jgi:hypothetical protein
MTQKICCHCRQVLPGPDQPGSHGGAFRHRGVGCLLYLYVTISQVCQEPYMMITAYGALSGWYAREAFLAVRVAKVNPQLWERFSRSWAAFWTIPPDRQDGGESTPPHTQGSVTNDHIDAQRRLPSHWSPDI